jgi:regulator of sirC expression with transglutaminase-like and TPR domain
VDSVQRFAQLVAGPESEVPLDEAMLLIARQAQPQLDVTAELQRLDDLADRCFAPTLDALVRHLFVDLGFRGNESDYYDPRNSFLNDVVTRRIGIPLSLSVLTIVVGRRLGVPLAGVSMPGHFLLRDKVDPTVFVDPFARGARLDLAGCERAFKAVHGPDAVFDPAFVEPVGSHAILRRALANLRGIYGARKDRTNLRWVLQLRAAWPDTPAADHRELASVLAASGRFGEAASAFELAAVQPGGTDDDRTAAARLRARLN